MPDWDKLTGYRLPGAAARLSATLKQDREKSRGRGNNVAEPTGPSMTTLDRYVTDTTSGKLARRKEATDAAAEGREPIYGTGTGFKKGGMVKKTGLAKVHAGERVLTKSQQKHMSKRMGK